MLDLIPTALAESGVTYTDVTQLNLNDIVYLFVALAILGAGALAIIFIFFGGFSFILSGGDESKVKQAIHTIRYAIIGLIIALLSLVFVPMVGRLFGVNFNFLDFEKLSNRINILFTQFQTEAPAASQTTASPANQNPEVSIENLVQ